MPVDDTVTDGKAEPGSFLFCREEGVEYILYVFLFDALAGVFERNDQVTGMRVDGSPFLYTYYLMYASGREYSGSLPRQR